MEDNNESIQIYQRYLLKQVINSDPVILDHIKNNEDITQKKIENLYNFYNAIKGKRMIIQIGKSMIRGILINTKKSVCSIDVKDDNKLMYKLLRGIKPVMSFIEPENIQVELTDDEYMALINDIVKKKKSKVDSNVYILIGTNMLMSLVSSNFKSLIDNMSSNASKSGDIKEEEFSKLYEKIINSESNDDNNVEIVKTESDIDNNVVINDSDVVVINDSDIEVVDSTESRDDTYLLFHPQLAKPTPPTPESILKSSSPPRIKRTLSDILEENESYEEESEHVPKKVRIDDKLYEDSISAILQQTEQDEEEEEDEDDMVEQQQQQPEEEEDVVVDVINFDDEDVVDYNNEEDIDVSHTMKLQSQDLQEKSDIPEKKNIKIKQMLDEFKKNAEISKLQNKNTKIKTLSFE